MSSGLQLKNIFISSPYINPNKKSENPVDQLVVNIVDTEEKETSNTIPLKYAYRDYYPDYAQYLSQRKTNTLLYNEIQTYLETLITTPIKYKYNVGQYGYLKNGDSLEKSFIMITGISKLEKEIYFLHCDKYLYEYKHYDITSSESKLLQDSNLQTHWMTENDFIAVKGCVEPIGNDELVETLNWMICREDYLTRALQEQDKQVKKQKLKNIIIQFRGSETKENDSTEYYTTTPNYSGTESVIRNTTNAYKNITNITNNNSIEEIILASHGYKKDKDFTKTLKGEVFIAVNYNNYEEPVAIKKMYNQNIVLSNEKMRLVREELILRNNFYIDIFQSERDFYVVSELDFSVTLYEFVIQAHKYINIGKLKRKEYKKVIKYLLWSIISKVHALQIDEQADDLDLCPENIMLRDANFIEKNDGLLTINPRIEMKLIDISVRKIVSIGAKDKLKQFEYMYNNKYLSENEQFILPNNNNTNRTIWSYGMIVFFCLFGEYPYANMRNPGGHGYQIISHLRATNSIRCINQKIFKLLNGIFNSNPSKKKFDTYNIMKHNWFSSFYKHNGGN